VPDKPSGGRTDWNTIDTALCKIEAGCLVDAAFISCGVDREVFERWLGYEKVAKKVEEAQARFISCAMQKIAEGASEAGHLRWLLERIAPSEFAKPSVELRRETAKEEKS